MLVLVIVATILSVTFATRAAMATNRPVIEVLHFIGARNSFITGHFQRHFLRLGLKGGAIGGGGAIALFALAEMSGRWSRGDAGGDQIAALFGTLSIGVLGLCGGAGAGRADRRRDRRNLAPHRQPHDRNHSLTSLPPRRRIFGYDSAGTRRVD